MDQLRALHYFVIAAGKGSFAGAARHFDVSVPSIQKLITALEAKLGVRLFERTSRGLKLTASGDTYLGACQPLLEELAGIDESLARSASRPSGTLVVAAHPQLAHHLLLPALPRFRARCPDIHLDVRVIHRLGDADGEVADVFVLHGWPEASELVHQRLGLATSRIVAAPEYWIARGVPQHPRELLQHECLLMRNPAGILIDLWEFERDSEKVALTVGGWLSSNDREVVLDAVLAGAGVGRLNELTTRAHLHSGRLVPVLQEWEVKGGPPVNVLYRPHLRRTPRVRLFVDFVAALLREAESGMLGQTRSLVDRPHWHRRGYGRASSVLRGRTEA